MAVRSRGSSLGLVPQLRHVLVAEQGVVVESHLGIQRQQTTVSSNRQRVDLQHGRVEIVEDPEAGGHHLNRLGDQAGIKSHREGDLASLEGLKPDGRLHVHAHDGSRIAGRDVLDSHATRGRGHDHHPLGGPVEHEPQVDLALGGHGRLHVQAVHAPAPLPGLVGDQSPAQQVVGRVPHLPLATAELDASSLTPSPGMDLGLHYPVLAADLGGSVGRLLGTVGKTSLGYGHAVVGEYGLGLVLVNLHERPSLRSPSRTARD